jgi:hypothetical protein
VCTFCSTPPDTCAKERSSHILPRHYRDGQCSFFKYKINMGDETWCCAYGSEAKRQSSEWVGETSPRPKELIFQKSRKKTMLITFLTLGAQRLRTIRKSSKCRILWRSNGSPPEAHTTGSSSCVLLSRFYLVARYYSSPQSWTGLHFLTPKTRYNPSSPPVHSRFIPARLFSVFSSWKLC